MTQTKLTPKQLKLGELSEVYPFMSAQELFNSIVGHLLAQGRMSVRSDGSDACVYKGEGVCCAAAPLIKNYSPRMESHTWKVLVGSFQQNPKHRFLILSLQYTHDNYFGQISEIYRIAERTGLAVPNYDYEKYGWL